MSIHGEAAPGFEPVADAFRDNFRKRRELGAALCIYQDGKKVVDLWGGLADEGSGKPWAQDTLNVLFSGTKGMASLCLLMLADRGKLDYDLPIATYWPEFAQGGKENITVRQLLNHSSGLCAVDAPLTLDDLRDDATVCAAIETQQPLWEPGQNQGYHGVTMGMYAKELIRRISGMSATRFFAEQVAGPLNADVFLRLPQSEQHRVSTLVPIGAREALTGVIPALISGRSVEGRIYRQFLKKSSETHRAFGNPAELGTKGIARFNERDVQSMELLWASGVGSAEGLARVYAPLSLDGSLEGVRLVSKDTLREPSRPGQLKQDLVLRKPITWNVGFLKDEPHIFSPNPEAFGHSGIGGIVGFADPEARVSFAYVMNRMDYHLRSPRCLALCHAMYGCL